jgi:hypothetical protein
MNDYKKRSLRSSQDRLLEGGDDDFMADMTGEKLAAYR